MLIKEDIDTFLVYFESLMGKNKDLYQYELKVIFDTNIYTLPGEEISTIYKFVISCETGSVDILFNSFGKVIDPEDIIKVECRYIANTFNYDLFV